MPSSSADSTDRANQRNAVIAAFLGWTLDAFDFFILVMVIHAVASDLHRSIPAITLTLTASLATRPIGALIFGLMADRYGRRLPLMLDIVLYSVVELLSGLAPSYKVFLILRLIYGIGMGGEWGVGASLAMESIRPSGAAWFPDCCRKATPPATCWPRSPTSSSSRTGVGARCSSSAGCPPCSRYSSARK